jgi:peptide-methionine (S)-S-oxide reductase
MSKIPNAVTEIAPFKNFYPAEEKHKEYYIKNKGNLYCSLVIDPKIQKLKKEFSSLLK